MRNKAANLLIGIGAILVLAAMLLFLYNQWEAAEAERTAAELVHKLADQIETNDNDQHSSDDGAHLPDPYSTVMDTVQIDGNDYIGYLTIPDLKMELPIMSDWSRKKLRIAPCRYAGSVGGEDLVIMGHNYDRIFGRLSQMNVGNEVYFRDVNDVVTAYKVVAKDILGTSAVADMLSGEYDLTLFTCTYDLKNRLTIRCDKIS